MAKINILILFILTLGCRQNPAVKSNLDDENTNGNYAYVDKLDAIFKKSSFDYFPEHNQTIDALKIARETGLIPKSPATLIHVDAHPDYATSEDNDYHKIGSYINYLLVENYVSKVYFIGTPYEGRKSSEDTLYIDKNRKIVTGKKPDDYDTNQSKYTKVVIPTILVEELPAISSKGDTPIILDIDADYFPNIISSEEELDASFGNFLDALSQKGITPDFTTGAMSKKYVNYRFSENEHPKVLQKLERFFQDIGAHSKTKGDLVAGYDHQRESPNQRGLPIIKRVGNSDLQALYALRFVDFHNGSSVDGKVSIDKSDPKGEKATAELVRIYGSSEEKVKKTLEDWDAADGQKDGKVDYNAIEKQLIDKLQGSKSEGTAPAPAATSKPAPAATATPAATPKVTPTATPTSTPVSTPANSSKSCVYKNKSYKGAGPCPHIKTEAECKAYSTGECEWNESSSMPAGTESNPVIINPLGRDIFSIQ
ncbi:MAG: hypothetical protein HQK54_07855 [Oligoflexales bacterium]|nr:hypothetical protein [Oligoflexales bacterium]